MRRWYLRVRGFKLTASELVNGALRPPHVNDVAFDS